MIFQKHEKHGRHIAYSPQEAESNRKNGWKDVSREEFYAKKATAVEANVVVAIHKKRGPKPKVRVE